ncbi:sulfatase-like hydrolase/transferase [Seonamhaeicola sp.]|uniref:sulfatase-like hydrolase/transferase n=1 Tax=Seonamhaeicola sp. TaxID=1912245 RepID=UPI00260DDD46|nr:sulfatase-like hydrolase/transferase [Seonamhaeicola sp.]
MGQKPLNSNLRPNIVFILADDCTHWDIGCYGSKDSKTPNIDKLASEGMQFERCYQAAPMCSPTRHNIFTGIYPVKTEAYPNHTNANPGTESIVQYLKPLGYRVALSGKTHIGPKKVFPFEYLGNDRNPDFELVEAFLKEVKENKQPFALVLTSNEPHTPWDKGDASLFNPDEITLPPHYVDTKETRKAYCRYLAEINYLDGQVGEVMDLLDKYGFSENTLVVFASEQGNNFPFAKWTLYEAGVKSALIARMPGVIQQGTESSAIVEYCDLLPTFIDVAGGKIPEKLDGESLLPIFKNEKEEVKPYSFSLQTTRGIFSGSDYYGIRAVVDENYRYIWNLTPEVKFKNTVNNKKDKATAWYRSWEARAETDERARALIHKYAFRPEEELYDVKNDKWCMSNLAGKPEFESIKKKLRKELLKWMAACGDKGQQTELEAFQYMPKFKRKKEIEKIKG